MKEEKEYAMIPSILCAFRLSCSFVPVKAKTGTCTKKRERKTGIKNPC
jgi:hypothetical protein